MDLASIIVFATALFIAAATPGPGIAAIVARVLGRGPKGALAFTAGVALGNVVWLTFAVAGLAVLAQTFNWLFLAVKWAGVLYLLFLAWRMWRAPAKPADGAVLPRPSGGRRSSSPDSRSPWTTPRSWSSTWRSCRASSTSRRSGGSATSSRRGRRRRALGGVLGLCPDGGAGAQPLRRPGPRARAQPRLGPRHGRGGGLGGRALASVRP